MVKTERRRRKEWIKEKSQIEINIPVNRAREDPKKRSAFVIKRVHNGNLIEEVAVEEENEAKIRINRELCRSLNKNLITYFSGLAIERCFFSLRVVFFVVRDVFASFTCRGT